MATTRPRPRGETSAALIELLGDPPGTALEVLAGLMLAARGPSPAADPLSDADLQLSLELLYGVHYQDAAWVDDGWEWDPDLLRLRSVLEERLELPLLARVSPDVDALLEQASRSPQPLAPSQLLSRLVEADDGPSVPRFVQRHATTDQLRDLVAQKSLYHLREADFQTWQVPRLRGASKEALLQIQVDEYGCGHPGRLHQQMYAGLMTQLDLRSGVLDHLDDALPEALALGNTLHLFGLHRRHRGRSMGQLAAIEMTSSIPCRRLSQGLQRLGFPEETRAFYDEHVLADALHEQLASVDLVGSLVAEEPAQLRPVLEGAAAYLYTEGRLASTLLARWTADATATDPATARGEREDDAATVRDTSHVGVTA
jgi:hypothetical protein